MCGAVPDEHGEQEDQSLLFRRFRHLCAAGFEPSQALKLAGSPDLDVDAAADARRAEHAVSGDV
jgi:hypothetical protein